MRTKTLLLTAALGGAMTTAAMAQVYSQNVVGYVNRALPAGYSMIANPLINGNNDLDVILPSVPDGTTIFKFDAALGRFSDLAPQFVDGFGWFPSGSSLVPGEGAFILLPQATTLTFVGEVAQGTLSQNVPAGYSIAASQVPQSVGLDAMDFPANDGDTIFFFDNALQRFSDQTPQFVDGFGWFPTVPTPAVAESFFVLKTAARQWTRTFSVN
jgi:hypothetical protein